MVWIDWTKYRDSHGRLQSASHLQYSIQSIRNIVSHDVLFFVFLGTIRTLTDSTFSVDERGPNQHGLDSIFIRAIKNQDPIHSPPKASSPRRIKPITKHVATQYHWIVSWYEPIIHFAPQAIDYTPPSGCV